MNEWIITSSELKSILSTKPESIFLLDVREQEEYDEARIEGCTLIPLGELMMRAPAELNPEMDIVVYCAHGVRSIHALMDLSNWGSKKSARLKRHRSLV